ncbi:MAG: glycosyltransferase [Prevotella sp.]|jgi:glycosyltransferase involved in cell wall biosynthesis
MDSIKKVSVVMCTCNGEKFVKEQLDSIINQTYPLHEIIIQDDNSHDNTIEILEEYAKKDKRIHVYHNVPALGVNQNFFAGIKKTTGDFIALSDQDDIWELNKIELQMQAIGDKLLCSGLSKPFSYDDCYVSFDDRPINFNPIRTIFAGV